MAVSSILNKSVPVADATPACTVASLANGAGRISAQVDNSTIKGTRAQVGIALRTGTTPTANALIKVYLIREGVSGFQGGLYNAAASTALGAADAAAATEPIDSPLIGTIPVSATSDRYYSEQFPVADPGYKFSILIWNATGAALHATQTFADPIAVDVFCDEAQ
jgi:hypothetical protein